MAIPATGNHRFLMLNRIGKRALEIFYRPVLQFYLRKERHYRYGDIHIRISPDVFHPGLFYSTEFLLQQLKSLPLENNSLLELGCGSGIISLYAAKKGALVTASDINSQALLYLEKNAEQTGLSAQIKIVKSDLFENIQLTKFDYILINPPYYKKAPQSEKDHAWYCGENGEYFVRLFQQMPSYMHPKSTVLMVLSADCDISFIKREAQQNKLSLHLVNQKCFLFEYNYIFQIKLPIR